MWRLCARMQCLDLIQWVNAACLGSRFCAMKRACKKILKICVLCTGFCQNHRKMQADRTDVETTDIHTGKPLHATDIHQSHRMISNVKHTVHLQVRSGSERNRRHLVPRISIDLQVRLDDHQLIPSSWAYSPIKIISNYPNDVKTSGLQPPSSSSTYRRIGYSEWV